MIKNLALFFALTLSVASASAAGWEDDYARLLRTYVTPAGVKYAEWKANAEDIKTLQRVVDGIAAAPASAAKSADQLAFHLNAYNAWILHQALEKYPTKSVKDPLFTFFTSKRIVVAGEKMSFNRLEKDIIRPRFNEPRIHFALNCASRSCPPLRNAPFSGSTLDADLEQIARAFVNSPKGVAMARDGVQLSKIFEWYQEDFGGPAGTIVFINKRRAAPIPASARISYQEYDWGLNEAK
jgi:hypothetical protein